MNVVRFCRENRYAVYLVTGFLVAAGLWAMFVLPSNIYPELNFPRIAILVHAGDLAPEAMLLTVTRPLEEAASTVLGVRRVRSRTIRGAAEISVLFKPDMDMQYALQLVQGRDRKRTRLNSSHGYISYAVFCLKKKKKRKKVVSEGEMDKWSD